MKVIGIFLIKFSAFLLVGFGASLASIALPLLQYDKEAIVYLAKAEESMGQEVTEESCVLSIAKDSFAECKIGLTLKSRFKSYMSEYAKIANFMLRVMVVLFVLGAIFYFKGMNNEKRAALKE